MITRFARSFSILGLFVGLLFLCASLTPSLLPRMPMVQGVLGGVAFAVGYGTGRLLLFIWWVMGFAELVPRVRRIAVWGLSAASIALTFVTFSRAAIWQNSIRQRMDMPDVESSFPWLVAIIAAFAALVLILTTRVIIRFGHAIARLLMRVLPRRTALGLGGFLAVFVLFVLMNDVVIRKAVHAMEETFAKIDQIVTEDVEAPVHGLASGGPGSVIEWEDIGTHGKSFLTSGPSEAQIAAFTGRTAKEPIRVYAGYRSAEDFEARAEAALEELIAFGGFERSVLIVATPTGTGWLDPAAIEPVAFLHDGDIAIVATQYTYVPSWLSIMVEPDRSRHAARALFVKVYDYWTALPPHTRPELYLFGLSLGALGSESSADLVTVFSDPIDGAMWSGPPFASTVWARITAGRNPGSPAWLPEFRDGALVRFMNQDGIAAPEDSEWGQMRLLYLQYASDPMVFFSTDLAFRRPDWLGRDRGPDVSDYFDWYPLVTFLQVGFDVPMATYPPSGFGHSYHALDYIEGWIAVTQPEAWTDADTERLNALFADFSASPI